jgi:hypothetical protein
MFYDVINTSITTKPIYEQISVSYGNITALLIEAIKEQQLQIEELKTKLDAFTK